MDRSKLFTRLGKVGEDDSRADVYRYWDELGSEARFKAAWELVVEAMKIKGMESNEFRLQRSVTALFRKPS